MIPADASSFLAALRSMGIESYFYERPGETALPELQKAVRKCQACSLAKTRTNVVFGEGNPHARLLFIGEAPGEEEDLQGRPFVGRAGKMLDTLIDRVGLSRKDVYICNILKCRPPGNRDPQPDEVAACSGFLTSQLDLIGPEIVCTLGRHAYNGLLGVDEKITKVRGKLRDFGKAKLLPTYHPSFLLRNQTRIDEVWEDMDRLRDMLRH